jgi:hypothetical protein
MIKHLRQVSVILLFSSVSFIISGQEQAGFLDRLSERFESYCKKIPWEEIFVHTDREEYIAGENLWLKVYCIDRQSNKPSTESNIAYFEILNSENRPVIQKRIRLENGSGPGEVLLSDTLSSGSYIVREYTNQMKNFLPSNCFMKKITIYNALSPGRFKRISNKAELLPRVQLNSNPSATTGFNFRIDRTQTDIFDIIIDADRNFRSQKGSTCYLFIQTHGIINFKSVINLTGDVTRKSIPADILIPGINQIVIFDQAGKPIAGKYFWTPAKESGSGVLKYQPGSNSTLNRFTGS